MNKTQKAILIAAIAVVVGLVLLVAAAIAAGGDLARYLAAEDFPWSRHYSLGYEDDRVDHDQEGHSQFQLWDEDSEFLSLDIEEDFLALSIDNGFRDIRLAPAATGQARVEYPHSKDETYSIAVNDQGVLEIKGQYSRRLLDLSFDFHDGRRYALVVYLPEDWRGDIDLSSDFGDIKLEGLSCGQLDINSDYGDLRLADVSCAGANLRLDCGDITLVNLASSGLKAQLGLGGLFLRGSAITNLELSLDCGDFDAENLRCDSLEARLSLGDMDLKGLEADQAQLRLSAGSLEFEDLDAQHLEIDCDLGNARGELAGSWSDYEIHSSCALGRNNLADRSRGQRYLNVRVDAGDIMVEFDED